MAVAFDIQPIIAHWNQSSDIVNNQIKFFNDRVKDDEHLITPEDLKQIYDITNEQFQVLKDLNEQILKRQQEKGKGKPDNKIGTGSKWWHYGGAGLTIVGVIMTQFNTDVIKIVGGVIAGIGVLCEVRSQNLQDQKNNKAQEDKEIAELEKEGTEQTKTFKKFIKRFKEIQEELAKSRTANDQPQVQTVQTFQHAQNIQNVFIDPNLDKKISNCLTTYGCLPDNIKSNDVLSRILSVIIQRLPDNDPLKREMNALSSSRVSVVEAASHPLPIEYIKPESSEESDVKINWVAESIPLDSEHQEPSRQDQLNLFIESISSRFDISKDLISSLDINGGGQLQFSVSDEDDHKTGNDQEDHNPILIKINQGTQQ